MRRPKAAVGGDGGAGSETERGKVMNAETTEATKAGGTGIVCVLDLGEHPRKRIKRLRRGEGKPHNAEERPEGKRAFHR